MGPKITLDVDFFLFHFWFSDKSCIHLSDSNQLEPYSEKVSGIDGMLIFSSENTKLI